MRELHAVLIGMRRGKFPLEVPPTHEAGVDICGRKADGTYLLKIEIEEVFLDSTQVGALARVFILSRLGIHRLF